MSLLNPVLLPPRVKAYLSQGERFIKWDDVSGAGEGCCGDGVADGLLRALPGELGWFMSARIQAPMWLGQAADTAVQINKPRGEGACPRPCPWAARGLGSVCGCERRRAARVVTGGSLFGSGSSFPPSPQEEQGVFLLVSLWEGGKVPQSQAWTRSRGEPGPCSQHKHPTHPGLSRGCPAPRQQLWGDPERVRPGGSAPWGLGGN